jgi:hypothetical protein
VDLHVITLCSFLLLGGVLHKLRGATAGEEFDELLLDERRA